MVQIPLLVPSEIDRISGTARAGIGSRPMPVEFDVIIVRPRVRGMCLPPLGVKLRLPM